MTFSKKIDQIRNFGQSNYRSNHVQYIDVWSINVFEPCSADPFNVVSLFMMQLACIINMLPVWKKLEVRVFLCETYGNQQSPTSLDNMGLTLEPSAYVKLSNLLNSLRIQASIHEVR